MLSRVLTETEAEVASAYGGSVRSRAAPFLRTPPA